MLKHIISVYRHEFRIWIRKRARPLSIEEAEEKKFFWAKMYAFSSLVLLIMCTRNAYKIGFDKSKVDGVPEEISCTFARDAKNDVRVIKFEGFTKVKDVTYSAEEVQEFRKKIYSSSSAIGNPEDHETT